MTIVTMPRVVVSHEAEVPLWGVDEVVSWVTRSGFQDYGPAFRECGVDGDMLLQLTDVEIKDDIGIKNGILRKRFIRELKELKKTADYTSCDGGITANFLARVGPEYRGYTYSLIQGELSLDLMQRLSAADLEDMLKDCGVESAIHRHKIVDAAINGTDDESFADSLYSEPSWDVYLAYPSKNGGELASLIKMQLEMRGLAVSVDPHDSPCLSEASLSLIRESRHLVLVLPTNGLDTCINRLDGKEVEDDLLYSEILAALAAGTKIIPVTADFQWPSADELPEEIREIAAFNSVRWVHDYQDACLDKLDRFIRGEAGSLKVDSPHSTRRADSGRSTPCSLLLPTSSSPTILNRFLKNRAVSIDSDIGSQST